MGWVGHRRRNPDYPLHGGVNERGASNFFFFFFPYKIPQARQLRLTIAKKSGRGEEEEGRKPPFLGTCERAARKWERNEASLAAIKIWKNSVCNRFLESSYAIYFFFFRPWLGRPSCPENPLALALLLHAILPPPPPLQPRRETGNSRRSLTRSRVNISRAQQQRLATTFTRPRHATRIYTVDRWPKGGWISPFNFAIILLIRNLMNTNI